MVESYNIEKSDRMSEKQLIEELIIRYLQQEIDEEELRILENWLEQSPENKHYFFQLKSISDSSRRPAYLRRQQGEISWKRMEDRLKHKPKGKSPSTKFVSFYFWKSFLKYAGIILAAISIGWGMGGYLPLKNKTQTSPDKVVYNQIRVEKGGRANTLLLSDGSKIVLNAATTFTYPTTFGEKERMVYLDGEAYFEVAQDAEKPFIVRLKKQDITVLGTSFNVEAYGNDAYSIVTLLNGKITLETFNEKGESMSQMFLKPNQKAFSDNQTGSVSLQETDASLAGAWIKGVYKFKDEPLSSIMKRLENYYDVRIHLENESVGRIQYTGTFALDQDIREVLRIINYENQFVFKQTGKEICISHK